jgi:hypothetical protein
MKKKESNEQEKFDDVMDKLLAVPYSELQKKLEEEKKLKKKRKRSTSSGDARASSERT